MLDPQAAGPRISHVVRDRLRWEGVEVVAAHPAGVRLIAASDSKTDRKDAEALAHLLRTGFLPRAYIPDPETLRLRDLLRCQIDLGRGLTRAKNRVHAFLARHGAEVPFTADRLFGPRGLAWLERQHWGDSRDAILQVLKEELDSLQRRRDILRAQVASVAHEDTRGRSSAGTTAVRTGRR